jgi:pimeloyl-ACP methyl ester carboxylesterase
MKIGWVVALVAMTGCRLLTRDTPTPIPTLARPLSALGRARTLVVWLPGRGDTMADFDRQGIVATMREAGVAADAIVVDAHLGYYYKRTIIERLRADVLVPARQKGYRRIVLVGVSLGGLGSLLNERDNPGAVDALVLLSPNLGDEDGLFDRMAAAGGPAAWAAGRDPKSGSVYEELWTFLGTHVAALPPTWLFYGRDDPYGRGHHLFATLLPVTRVTTVAGAHDWPTWRALWHEVCFHSEVFQAERAGSGL